MLIPAVWLRHCKAFISDLYLSSDPRVAQQQIYKHLNSPAHYSLTAIVTRFVRFRSQVCIGGAIFFCHSDPDNLETGHPLPQYD